MKIASCEFYRGDTRRFMRKSLVSGQRINIQRFEKYVVRNLKYCYGTSRDE